jgi:hypothetical protein
MSWWFGPSLLIIIAAGIAAGLLVSYFIIRSKKKEFAFRPRNHAHAESLSPHVSANQLPDMESKTNSIPLPTAAEIFSIRPLPPVPDRRVEEYLGQRTSVSSGSSPVNQTMASFLLELENNLSIASKPVTDKLISFHTDIWNTRRSDLNTLDQQLVGEISEAYVDMLLANNFVWLVTELGRNNRDITDSYSNLTVKIAERLRRIIPDVRNCIK